MKSTVTIQFDTSPTKKRRISGYWRLNGEGKLLLGSRLQELIDKYQTGPRRGWSDRDKKSEYDILYSFRYGRYDSRARRRAWSWRLHHVNNFLGHLKKFYTEYEINIESRMSEYTNHDEWMGDYFNNLICEKYEGSRCSFNSDQCVQTFHFKNGERGRACHEYLEKHFAQRPYMPTGNYKLITFTDPFNGRAR